MPALWHTETNSDHGGKLHVRQTIGGLQARDIMLISNPHKIMMHRQQLNITIPLLSISHHQETPFNTLRRKL